MTKLKKQTYIKGLIGAATLGVIAYSTGILSVLGGFWRAVYPDQTASVANPGTLNYGYGYGSLGWGYGYGYGYNYGYGTDEAGYYYSTPTTGSAAYANPITVSASDMASVSIISGSITAATQVTITTTVQFTGANGVTVVLPAGLVITAANGGTMNLTQLAATFVSSPSNAIASTQTKVGAISFGIPGLKLNFSQPVLINIPLGIAYVSLNIEVFHAGDASYTTNALSNVATATCSAGVASPTSTVPSVSNGLASIYTCSASEFVAYDGTSSGGGSSGGGGGGGGGSSSSSSSSSSTGTYTQPSTGDIAKFEETIKNLATVTQQKMVNGQEVTLKIPTFSGENTNKVIALLTTKVLEAISTKKITGKDLVSIIDSYNKFLAAVKLYKDNGGSITNLNIAKLYARQMVAMLNSYPTIKASTALQDPEFEYALSFMKKNGLTKYDSVDDFRPFDAISRQEAAKFFVSFGKNVLGLTPDTSKECAFEDLAGADGTLTSYITEACQMGLMKGSSNKFRPFNPMSKGEAITVLIRAVSGQMLDETVEPWFANYFAEAQKLSLTKETDSNKLWKNLSRYEAGLLLFRAANK